MHRNVANLANRLKNTFPLPFLANLANLKGSGGAIWNVSTQGIIATFANSEEQKESVTIKAEMRKIDEALQLLDQKLRTLTRRLMDEIIDEDMYRAIKEDFLMEKASLTAEKNRLRREACNYWIEPTLTLISTLETLATMPDTASVQEFANTVRKIGTNPLISHKTVTFSFSKDYDFLPSLLASARVASPFLAPKRCGDFDENSQSPKWCPLVYQLKTHFSKSCP